MEIRGIRDVRDLETLLELVESEMGDVADGTTIYGGAEEQMAKLEQLNGLANALRDAVRENQTTDFGWKMID